MELHLKVTSINRQIFEAMKPSGFFENFGSAKSLSEPKGPSQFVENSPFSYKRAQLSLGDLCGPRPHQAGIAADIVNQIHQSDVELRSANTDASYADAVHCSGHIAEDVLDSAPSF